MKVWKMWRINQKYDDLIPVEEYSVEEMQSYDGRNHKEWWIPKKVKRMQPDNKRLLGDLSSYLSEPVFSENALKKWWSRIKDDVEVLPLTYDEGNFSLINVTTVLEAIDYEKAKFERFKSSGRIMCFDKFAFREEVIKTHCIFKIIDAPKSYVFVTDEFVNTVKKNRLKGFSFELVWDSEAE